MRNVAVVLAGGVGSRVGLSIPKQLIKIAGRPIIEHTIDVLNASPLIDEVIVMMTPGHLDPVRAIVANGGYDKVTRILEGADTRNGTTERALQALGDEECNVLFHDAVRPLLSQRIIEDCVAALETYEAVDTAIPSADTIIAVTDARRSRTSSSARSCDAARPPRRSAARSSAGPTSSPARTRTSRRPTTARSCCATCRRCRSRSSPATSAT